MAETRWVARIRACACSLAMRFAFEGRLLIRVYAVRGWGRAWRWWL
uniref:Uncharacterized protein n=1 Tax=Arundo donax TaxID=35708 RepID=A0A0A9BZL8_ARUDO